MADDRGRTAMSVRDKIREIMELLIEEHQSEGPCLFAPNAADNAADAVLAALGDDRDLNSEAAQRALYRSAAEAEIYCPHEGIDRRAEFGIAA